MANTIKAFNVSEVDKNGGLEKLRKRIRALPQGKFWQGDAYSNQWLPGKLPNTDQIVMLYPLASIMLPEGMSFRPEFTSKTDILKRYHDFLESQKDQNSMLYGQHLHQFRLMLKTPETDYEVRFTDPALD